MTMVIERQELVRTTQQNECFYASLLRSNSFAVFQDFNEVCIGDYTENPWPEVKAIVRQEGEIDFIDAQLSQEAETGDHCLVIHFGSFVELDPDESSNSVVPDGLAISLLPVSVQVAIAEADRPAVADFLAQGALLETCQC